MRPARGVRVALAAVLVPLLTVGPRPVLAGTGSASQTLAVNISALAKIHVVQSSVSLTHTGSTFGDFTGSATVQFKVRTTISTGSATVTTYASEFSPSNGPSVANGNLTYTCSGASLGTACSGKQTVSTSMSSQTNVVTVGSGACTGAGCAGSDPDTVTINLDLADSPTYKTGSYSTTVTFTVSAL